MILIGNIRCGHLGIRIDDFLLVHNIAQSSYTLLHNNLSLQIFDTFIMPENIYTCQICNLLWHFGCSWYSKCKLIWIGNMRCGHLWMRMHDFLLVHNIAQSSFTFLRNNLSLQIYDTFITSGWGMPTSRDSNRSTIWLWLLTYKFK